ncbi:hypothetical protein [Jannaschia aquimarina]|nr:hypothetical protein [Jannaschia aquimarina]
MAALPPFEGEHGQFWSDRKDEAITVMLSLRGKHSAIVCGG